MNAVIAVTVCCAVFGLVNSKPAIYYATRYDHIDVDTILNNRRMVNYYAACLLHKGPCPPQGVEFKRILPEALETNCARCTEKQKTIALRTIKRIRKEYPKIWDQLKEVWDPDDIYVTKFEATFGKKKPIPKPPIASRFGEDGDTNDVSSFPYPPAGKPSSGPEVTIDEKTTTTDKSKVDASDTSSVTLSTTKKPSTTTTTTPFTTATKITTTTPKPTTTSNFNTIFTKPGRPRVPPFIKTTNANIDATVSFGGKVVGNFVRGLKEVETVAKKVVETGNKLAGAVFSSIQTVVKPRIF